MHIVKLHNGISLMIRVNPLNDKFTLKIIKDSNILFSDSRNDAGNIDYIVYRYFEFRFEIYKNDILIFSGDSLFKNKDSAFYVVMSKGLGDCIAGIPYLLDFKKKHNCRIVCLSVWGDLFKDSYPEIEFKPMPRIECGQEFSFDFKDSVSYLLQVYQHEMKDWRRGPLQKVMCDHLDLPYQYKKCNLTLEGSRPIKEKYICISSGSTMLRKEWMNDSGWEKVCEFLLKKGYRIFDICQDPAFEMEGVESIKDKKIEEAANIIKYCEFYIGLSSGISWLAWALNRPVFMISGFSNDFHEFPCYRIQNTSVCHGCLHEDKIEFDTEHPQDCPKDLDFICTRSIKAEDVIKEINKSGLLNSSVN